MGLLDWLFGRTPSNVEILPDRIWLTKAAKTNGLFREVEAALQSPQPPMMVLLVCHFEESLVPLQTIADGVVDGPPVCVTTADRLSHRFESEPDESQTILVLVSERHPLRSQDDRILDFARSVPCRCRVAFHVSLEDPLMQLFAGGWVEGMLKKLGMSEDEAIESDMVSRRVAAAQKKIEGECRGNSAAGSAEEWLARNCPDLWRNDVSERSWNPGERP